MILVLMFLVDGHVPARTNVIELGNCMWFGYAVILNTMTVVGGRVNIQLIVSSDSAANVHPSVSWQ
jgi:hypothetical protein